MNTNAYKMHMVILLFPVILTWASRPVSPDHGVQQQAQCHQLQLCSLGKFKPFLGDIYDSEQGGHCLSV